MDLIALILLEREREGQKRKARTCRKESVKLETELLKINLSLIRSLCI